VQRLIAAVALLPDAHAPVPPATSRHATSDAYTHAHMSTSSQSHSQSQHSLA
jgi:hypothetical protein